MFFTTSKLTFTILLSLLTAVCSAQQPDGNPGLEPGVTKTLADYRASVISNINYTLSFDIPKEKAKPIPATEILSFELKSVSFPLQVDFKGDATLIKQLMVNGKQVPVECLKEHLVIVSRCLKKGINNINIKFNAGTSALNRNDDYLYSLLVPDRARTVFPCFDQPNLKATFTLSLQVPLQWNAIGNGALKDTLVKGDRKTYNFTTSDKISTYLFSFAAGKFTSVKGKVNDKIAEFLYRETDEKKIKFSVDSIFKAHTDAINFLQDWTNIPYPFQKVGFVGIPDFQFGGMEHPGAVQYKASSLFLESGATKDQFIGRSNLISHETAHMWFGDMVSIEWFNDVWMKEVFANFMADKVSERLTGKQNFDLKFLTDHFPAAYSVDRTLGANPIRQQLDNLNEAGSLYGNIIYHKAPIMMRQLERLMGKDNFQKGVREYLKQFAYRNASWPDLINILNKYSKVDLLEWNKVWVNESGRPVFDSKVEYNGSKIKSLTIIQKPEYGAQRVWPQIFEVMLFYPDHTKELTVNMTGETTVVNGAANLPKPQFILFNSSAVGYGLWPVDQNMLPKLYDIKDPVMRASAYISLYENMLNARYIKPADLLNRFVDGLDKEKEELDLGLLTSYITGIYWRLTLPVDREKTSVQLESKLWAAMQSQTSVNNKKLLFKAYQDVFMSKDAYRKLFDVWQKQQPPTGIKLTEEDYTSLAFALKLRNDADTSILNQQLKRITNPDRIKRFKFIMPAVSASVIERDQFFTRLQDRKNREKESNVLAALGYLHHPLRQSTSVKYLKKSLEMLQEIQVTGDIFFPQSWLQSSFSSYQTAEANQIVLDFLKENPNYNSKLKAKISQAADNITRSQKLLY